MHIIFERNYSEWIVEEKGITFDCYHGESQIGRFEIYKNHIFVKAQEIYIEVYTEFQHQGLGESIYFSFLEKYEKLGFRHPVFYASVYKDNKQSIKFHNKLCEKYPTTFSITKTDYKDLCLYKIKGGSPC